MELFFVMVWSRDLFLLVKEFSFIVIIILLYILNKFFVVYWVCIVWVGFFIMISIISFDEVVWEFLNFVVLKKLRILFEFDFLNDLFVDFIVVKVDSIVFFDEYVVRLKCWVGVLEYVIVVIKVLLGLMVRCLVM